MTHQQPQSPVGDVLLDFYEALEAYKATQTRLDKDDEWFDKYLQQHLTKALAAIKKLLLDMLPVPLMTGGDIDEYVKGYNQALARTRQAIKEMK